MVLMAPPPPPKPMQPKPNQGGGGGSRSPLPPLKAQLPKPAPKQFVPPLVTIEHPALVMDASLIAPPDAWAAPTGAIGNPLGQIGGGGDSAAAAELEMAAATVLATAMAAEPAAEMAAEFIPSAMAPPRLPYLPRWIRNIPKKPAKPSTAVL